MADHKAYSLFLSETNNQPYVLAYPEPLLGSDTEKYYEFYGYTRVEIGSNDIFIEKWRVDCADGKEGVLDIAYSKEERDFDSHIREKRLHMASGAFLRHMYCFVVPRDYYRMLVEKWCEYSRTKYADACKLLDFKEE